MCGWNASREACQLGRCKRQYLVRTLRLRSRLQTAAAGGESAGGETGVRRSSHKRSRTQMLDHAAELPPSERFRLTRRIRSPSAAGSSSATPVIPRQLFELSCGSSCQLPRLPRSQLLLLLSASQHPRLRKQRQKKQQAWILPYRKPWTLCSQAAVLV